MAAHQVGRVLLLFGEHTAAQVSKISDSRCSRVNVEMD